MAIEAELADGRVLEFPDGTDPAVIQSTVKRVMGIGVSSTPAAQAAPAPRQNPTLTPELANLMGGPAPKSKSVLEGQQMPAPEQEVRMSVNPEFIAKLQAQLDALPAEERQAKLAELTKRGDVYGRAARTVFDRYASMDKGVSPTLASRTDRRLEQQTERFISQGLNAEDAKNMAREQALSGRTRRDLAQMTADTVGEQADREAAKQAKEYGDAGFWSRVGGETKSQVTKSGLGLLSAYADLTGDTQMVKDLNNSRRIEQARGAAIPKGEGVFEKSAQGAMSSLAAQAPTMVISTLTGTAAPMLAQAAIQQFGDAYGEGRAAGLSGKESATRAIPLAAAEVFFERFGMTKALKGLRAHVDQFGVGSVPAYMAKAIATEIPPELATTATQYAIDAIPGIGLNKKPSMVGLYEQLEETLRQTVLQAGAVAGGATVISKTAQGIGKLLPEQERRDGYQQDRSYEGTAEDMMRQRGFLTPEAKQTQPPAPSTALPGALADTRIDPTLDDAALTAEQLTPAAKEQKITALADRIASRGVDPQDALRIAKLQVESDEQKKMAADEAAAEELPTYYPKEKNNRLNEIFLELVDKGIPPNKAQLMAGQQFAAEKEDRKIAAAQGRNIKKAKTNAATTTATTGATNVGQPITEASGVSTELAGQPDQNAPATGAGEPTTDGVVSAGPDVTNAPTREAKQPSALTPKVELEIDSGEAYAERTKDEPNAPRYEDTDARVNRIADRYEQAGMPEKAAEARESLQKYRPNYMGTAEREVQQDKELAAAKAQKQVPTETDPLFDYLDKRDALMTKLDEVQQQGSDLFDEQEKLRDKGILEGKGGSEYLDEINEAEKQRQAKNAEFDEIIAQIDALDAERAKTRGAQVGTETTETVQAETQGQEPAAEVKEKGKRGRKPLAPEQKTVSEQKRKQQRIDFNATNRKIDKIEADLNDAITPINEEEMDTDEQIKTLEEEKRRKKNTAIRALYEISRTNQGAPGKRAAELLKNPAITKRELNDAASAYDLQKKLSGPSANRSSEGIPDPAFAKFKNGAQALTHIIKTSKNPFQKFLAERLRSAVAGVEFMVIEEGDPLPAVLQRPENAKEWERARGLFLQDGKKRYVFVRGTSFTGNVGANNITVLHELLHAATNKRLELGLLASYRGFDQDAKITKFVREINDQMNTAFQYYEYLESKGMAPIELRRLVQSTEEVDEETGEKDYGIFTLPQEFLAYGMSDPVFQEFLNGLPSNKKNMSGFTRFVTDILDLFGLGKDNLTALSDLINVTDQLLSAKKTPTMRLVEYGMPDESKPSRSASLPPEDEEEVKPGTLSKTANPDNRTEKEVIRDVDIAINQVAESRTAEELAKDTSVLQLATDPKALVGAASRAYDAASFESKRVLLNGATTDFLVEMGEQEIPQLRTTYRYIQEMHGMTARLMEGAADPSTVLFNVVKQDPTMMRPLYDLALESTLAEIDPSTDRRSTKLNAKYDALTDKAKNAYKSIRDYFVDMASLYSALLDDQVAELRISSEDKANLMAKLKTIYEVGGNIVPYFSLVRRGNFWLRVDGKGKERQFYMFHTMQERDKVAEELAAKRKSSVDELKDSKEFETGNDIRSLRLDSYDNSAPKLTAVMDAVDSMKLGESDTSGTMEQRKERILEEKGKLKDAIYQMYLMSLPDQNFRKKFISREGVTGFTTDLMQNFSDTASAMSVQLARIKYGRKIRNSLLAARKSIENRGDLAPYTEEMEKRVNLELPVHYDESKINGYMDAAANFATRSAFLYFLSGASSALLQPISVIQFGLPLLGARHGYGATATEFARLLAVWNAYGITRKNSDGSTTFIMPTMRNSKAISLDPVEKRAMDHMIGRNVGQITLAGELMARKNEPTERTVSTTRRVAKGAWWGATGAMMQTAERLAQEGVFLMSFRLSRRNAKKKFRKTKAWKDAPNKGQAMADFENANFQSWIDQSVLDTHESLGNMTAENRPPLMRGSFGKVALQFNMFPLHNYIMLGKNSMKMIGLMKAKDRGEATKTLFGQLGMTTLLAGAVGAPGVYTMIGFISGMWRDNREKLPADLRELDFQTWFRQKFLPEQLGNEWAKLIDRGVLNYATGADFSSRLSLSNMWFREGKETKTEREGLAQWITDHLGATVSQALTYADALDAFKKGDYRTASEKIAPAFIRNWMFMGKQASEGAKDSKGNQLLSKDAVTTGELIWRTVGFNSDKLADLQTNNFKFIGLQQKIDNERGDILQRLDLHLRKNDMRQYKRAWDDMEKFNTKYPWVQIDDIAESIEKKQQQRGESWRGVGVTEKNAPYAVEALKKSRLAAAEAEREGKK